MTGKNRVCPLLMKATGKGICRSGQDCSACKYGPISQYVGLLPMTHSYLKTRIAQKRTHISREQKRLEVLETLLSEVESATPAKSTKVRRVLK